MQRRGRLRARGSGGERPSTCPGAYLETEMVEPGLRGPHREQAGQEGQEEPARRRPGPGEEPGTAAAVAPSQRHLHSSINIAPAALFRGERSPPPQGDAAAGLGAIDFRLERLGTSARGKRKREDHREVGERRRRG